MMSVWLVMPKPMLPFTHDTLITYNEGFFIDQVWPKLPEKMRKSINEIALKDFNIKSPLLATLPNSDNTNDANSNGN